VPLETFAWPHSRQLVASATASLFSKALLVELLLVELLLVELLLVELLLVEPKRVTLLQVYSLNPSLIYNLLTHLPGNTGAAAGKANGGARNNGQNAATGNTGAAAGNGNGNGNGNKKNNRSVAGTRLARYVVVDNE
jgi:hypothetical protein